MRPLRIALCLLVLVAPAAHGRAEDEPAALRALVLENADHPGAKDALTAAGFTVAELSLDAAPQNADLVFFGSASLSNDKWTAYVGARKDALKTFLDGGGVVVEMYQADSTFDGPSWLPDGLSAQRRSGEQAMLRVTGGEHPVVAKLPRHAQDPERLEVSTYRTDKASKSPFTDWRGFRALLRDTTRARDAVLLEAAVGNGRILLSSLRIDQKPLTDVDKPVNKEFFESLAAYVRDTRDGIPPEVVNTPSLGHGTPELGEPTPCRWDLGASDVAVYERRKAKLKDGTVTASGGVTVATVAGNDLRDSHQYFPAASVRADLRRILAFRLVPSDSPTAAWEITLPANNIHPIEIEGTSSAHAVLDAPAGHPRVWVESQWTFESKRRGEKTDTHAVHDGKAQSAALVDVDRGVILRAHVKLSYDYEKLDAKRGEKPKFVSETFEYRLRRVRPARTPHVQDEIDASIQHGLAWLREARQEDGQWKPHGKYTIGTNALVVVTLSACGVPRDDPLISETLDWIFTQKPNRTYDRAVALMAIDEAYAPLDERGRLGEGKKRAPRELPPERQKWVNRVAAELEKTNTSPGSWGYPPTGRVIPNFDTSNTQYAILGLHAATHMGYEPEESTWLGLLRHFELVAERKPAKGQVALVFEGEAIRDEEAGTHAATPVKRAGGFRYTTMQPRVWASMTCAGIASLALARHHLRRIGSKKLSRSVESAIEETMVGAWAWLDAHWALDRHPEHGNNWYYYFLYSLERAGILHKVKRVTGKDWYAEGVAHLLARQKDDGGWAKGGESAVPETCLALLFLQRATSPLTGK